MGWDTQEPNYDMEIDIKTGKMIGEKSRDAKVEDAMKKSVLNDIETMPTLAAFTMGEKRRKKIGQVYF